jgi:MFS transporter, SIT family, siderophore-iron:H+ symporter
MFCILTPALAIPIVFALGYGMRPRKKDPNAPVVTPPPRAAGKSFGAKFMSVFWQLDFVGLLLFVAGAGMILVTITIANGKGSKWSDGEPFAEGLGAG